MSTTKPLGKAQIHTALAELDDLAIEEYGVSLEALLLSSDPVSERRMQRLVGVVLKRKFAKPAGPVADSETRALRSWPWPDRSDSLEPIETGAAKELALLEQLRMPGSWNKPKPLTGTAKDAKPTSWGVFKDDAEYERGLFKILALYVVDKLNMSETKTLKAYLKAEESKVVEAGLDLATLLFDAGVTAPLAGLLGVPTLAVGVALVGIQYGFRRLTDPNVGRVGDSVS